MLSIVTVAGFFLHIIFIQEGFSKWKKVGDKLKKHADSDAHRDNIVRWITYKQVKSSTTVADQLLIQRTRTIASNHTYITVLTKLAALCAHQYIPFRGHDESNESDNKGNFTEILTCI